MKQLLILSIFLISCAQRMEIDEYKDPAITPYIVTIEQYYNITFHGSYYLGYTGSAAGICRISNGKKIIISDRYWPSLTESSKIVLLMHEFGHCALNKKHNNILMSDGCPVSVMFPNVLSDLCYDKHKEHYWKELL